MLIQLVLQHERHCAAQAYGIFFCVGESSYWLSGDEVGAVGELDVHEGCGAVADGGDDLVGGVEFVDEFVGGGIGGEIPHCCTLLATVRLGTEGKGEHATMATNEENSLVILRVPEN